MTTLKWERYGDDEFPTYVALAPDDRRWQIKPEPLDDWSDVPHCKSVEEMQALGLTRAIVDDGKDDDIELEFTLTFERRNEFGLYGGEVEVAPCLPLKLAMDIAESNY